MRAMEPVGIALGVLIGVVSGAVCDLLLSTARNGGPNLKSVAAVIGELLALPTFWFGGPWVTTGLVSSVSLTQVVPSYMVSLSVVFTLVVSWPLLQLVRQLGKEIGQPQGVASD